MQRARPIGLALSTPLVESLDKIARSQKSSRSSVARAFLVDALSDYERRNGGLAPLSAKDAALSRIWRPREHAASKEPTLPHRNDNVA